MQNIANMAVLKLGEKERRMDVARQMFARGEKAEAVALATGLSPYLLSLLAMPEAKLRAIVESDAEEERARSFERSRELRRRREIEAEEKAEK